jgi:hypothetical protein
MISNSSVFIGVHVNLLNNDQTARRTYRRAGTAMIIAAGIAPCGPFFSFISARTRRDRRSKRMAGVFRAKQNAARTPCRAKSRIQYQSRLSGMSVKRQPNGTNPAGRAFCHCIQLELTKTDRTDINTTPFH